MVEEGVDWPSNVPKNDLSKGSKSLLKIFGWMEKDGKGVWF